MCLFFLVEIYGRILMTIYSTSVPGDFSTRLDSTLWVLWMTTGGGWNWRMEREILYCRRYCRMELGRSRASERVGGLRHFSDA